MSASYPSSVATLVNPVDGNKKLNDSSQTHSAIETRQNEEIMSIETELGTGLKGSLTSLAERLNVGLNSNGTFKSEAISIESLSDVTLLSGLADGQLLKYDSVLTEWINWTPTFIRVETDPLSLHLAAPVQTIVQNPIFSAGLTLTAGQDIRPSADSTTAINIAQADGTDFVTFDTTNKKTTFGGNVALSPGSLGSELAPSLAAANWTLGTGWHTGYFFLISTAITTAPTVGDTYTNNSVTFTIVAVNIASATTGGSITCSGSGAPAASGNLTRATGSGDATIAFASVVSTGLFKDVAGTGTAAPSSAITPVANTIYKLVITVANWFNFYPAIIGGGSTNNLGTATISFGGTNMTRKIAYTETITEYIKATNTNNLIITPLTAARFVITSISIKAIGSTGTTLPTADGVNALITADSSGLPLMTYDTTNKRLGWGQPVPAVAAEFQVLTDAAQSDVASFTNFATTQFSGAGFRVKTGAWGGGSIGKCLWFITDTMSPNATYTGFGSSGMTLQCRENGTVGTRFYLGPSGESCFSSTQYSPPIPTKLSHMTIQQPADKAISGTTTANASTTITGVGTNFLYELGIGDRISLSSASTVYGSITAIASATSLTVSVALGNGTTQTINRKKSLWRLDNSSGTALALINDQGYMNIGQGAPPTYALDIQGTTAAAGINSQMGYNINLVTPPIAPTGAPSSGSGMTDGNYKYFVTYTTAIGETGPGSQSATIAPATPNSQVTLTIPVSTDIRVTGRKIYRNRLADITNFYYLAAVADNTTTTYIDTIADPLAAPDRREYLPNTTSYYITVAGLRVFLMDVNATLLGYNAGAATVGAGGSTFLGSNAGRSTTTGTFNTAIGDNPLYANVTGSGNVGIGRLALYASIGTGYNVGIGYNSAFGITTGNYNIGIGFNCARTTTTGNSNIFLGTNAGYDVNQKPTVADSIAIGNGAYSNRDYQMVLGGTTNTEALIRGDTFVYKTSSLGAEKITNPNFTGAATSWTLGAAWAYGTDNVQKNAAGTSTLSQASATMVTPLVVGEMYYLSYVISAVSGTTPTIQVSCGGYSGHQVATAGTLYHIFVATNTDSLVFTPNDAMRCTVDTVSLKKITGGNLTIGGNMRAMGTFNYPVLAAGTATAGTAPLKFTSGTLNTTAEAGAVEFLTDAYYATQTTGATRKEIKLVDQYYGELYKYENAVSTTIGTQNVYHAVTGCTAGSLNGFTLVAGIQGTIASVANYSGTVAGTILITDVAHGLLTGDIITIHATTNYNGTYSITKVTNDTFYVTKTYVATETGEWSMGCYLLAGAGSAGMYKATWSNTALPASNNEVFKFELNKNTTPQDNIAGSNKYGTAGDYKNMGASGLVSLAVGDRIWLSVKNETSGADITIRHLNMNLVRL